MANAPQSESPESLTDLETSPEDERSLGETFTECEAVVEACLRDQLAAGEDKNEKLRKTIGQLQGLAVAVRRLALFSGNETADDVPTASLRFLLVPGYLAYALTDLNVPIEKRAAHLRAAKFHYREYVRTLAAFELVTFRLPWATEEEDEECDDDANNGPTKTKKMNAGGGGMEEALARREQKVCRLRQIDELSRKLDQLRQQRARDTDGGDDDSSTQRELTTVLLRCWAMRALNELELIEEELKMVEQFASARREDPGTAASTAQKAKAAPLRPFIIARNQQQKAVFGAGYPSVPTVTVDEWYNEMAKSGAFGQRQSQPKNGGGPSSSSSKSGTFQISAKNGLQEGGDKEEDEADSNGEDERRRAAEQMADWKERHPRGWGNTYNKG